MKRMLINATQPEELRVALVDGQRLYDLDIENRTRVQKKSNIYKGKITRVEPSLEAAFVDFGQERHGFLPLKEISREYFTKNPSEVSGRVKIKDVVKEGTEVIVQVDKEERGNKGAAISTFISLAGRYLVLMPNNPRAGGISRRIEGEERDELKASLSKITIPKGMGVIIRTAGVGRTEEDLQADLEYLLHLWDAIQNAHQTEAAPSLLYQESNVIIRAIRDYLRRDIDEVLIDNEEAYNEALAFIHQVMPHYESRIKLYSDTIPLFNRYQIESQIESAFQREVQLPSGGSIVIDPTEAMVAIDINSARATKGGDIEETALQTNIEAAEEIARQLRLRDMGGLVVIDFIDMSAAKNQREVENRMRKALQMDRARVQVGKISRFGLLEMSRQRLRPSLGETSNIVCPRCNGQGTIRATRSLSLSILRLLDEQAGKDRSGEIRAIVPVDVATYLLNEKRPIINAIEKEHDTRVLVIPDPNMETPHYEMVRLRDDDNLVQKQETSYKVSVDRPDDYVSDSAPLPLVKPEQAAVKSVTRTTPAADVKAVEAKKPGLLGRIVSSIFGASSEETPPEKPASKAPVRSSDNSPERNNDRNGSRNENRGDKSRNDKNRNNRNQNKQRNRNEAESENKGNRNNRNKNQNDRNRNKNKSGQDQDNAQSNQQSKAQGNDKGGEKRPQKRPQNKGNRGPNARKRGERTDQQKSDNTELDTNAVSTPVDEQAVKKDAPVTSTENTAASIAAATAGVAIAGAAIASGDKSAQTEAKPAEGQAQSQADSVSEQAPETGAAASAEETSAAKAQMPKAESPVDAAPAAEPKAQPVTEPSSKPVSEPSSKPASEKPKVDPAPVTDTTVEATASSKTPLMETANEPAEQPAKAMVDTDFGPRATNDPRLNPAKVTSTEIKTSTVDMTPKAEAVIPVPNPKSTQRAINDPRGTATEAPVDVQPEQPELFAEPEKGDGEN